jgi:hypothetical protein
MATKDFTLSQNGLHQKFEYKDGFLYWKSNSKRAGCLLKSGYWKIKINQKPMFAHRLIFLMHYGYLPKMIDHIDENRANNYIQNLRECSNAENQWNTKSKTSTKNVSWHKIKKKWRVQIRVKSNPIFLGYYDDIELATSVAQEAREKYHGTFANHN